MRSYAINEIFYSLQGEGNHAGTPALFIRFAGCNLRCPFCDTDFSKSERWTIWELEGYFQNLNPYPPMVVLTGGEPTLQVDLDICALLHRYFDFIAIETNGTTPKIAGLVDWVTLSPKEDYTIGKCALRHANEVKVVFDGEHDPEKWLKIRAEHYYLQPCDTGDAEKNREILESCISYILDHPQWKLSLQTQKIINVK